MANKVLLIPNYDGQPLPAESLGRFNSIYLVTPKQENLPVTVVMQLLQLASKQQVNIEFLQLQYTNQLELLLSLAFTISRMAANADTVLTIVSSGQEYDLLIDAAKNNGYNVMRADDFTGASAGANMNAQQAAPIPPKPAFNPEPKREQPYVHPVEVQQNKSTTIKPAATITAAPHKPTPVENNNNGSQTDKNKKLIASLLNGN